MNPAYFQLLILRFIRLWIEVQLFGIDFALVRGEANSVWKSGVQLHKEISHVISPKVEPQIDEGK